MTKCDEKDGWCQFYAKNCLTSFMNDPLEEHPTPISLVVLHYNDSLASHCGVTEDSKFLARYAVWTVEHIPTFRIIVISD